MKILKDSKPLKEPYWKYKGFGIPLSQLTQYDIVQTRCSYRNAAGTLLYPFLYQIESKKALERPYHRHGQLVVIPIQDWEIVNETTKGE